MSKTKTTPAKAEQHQTAECGHCGSHWKRGSECAECFKPWTTLEERTNALLAR